MPVRPILQIPNLKPARNDEHQEEFDDYDELAYNNDHAEQPYLEEGEDLANEQETEQMEAQPPAKRRKVVDIGHDLRSATTKRVAFDGTAESQNQLVLIDHMDEEDEEDDDFVPRTNTMALAGQVSTDSDSDGSESSEEEDESDDSDDSDEDEEEDSSDEDTDEDETSCSSSDASSESSSEEDEPQRRPNTINKAAGPTQMLPRAVAIKQKNALVQAQTPPGKGTDSTRFRNGRRRATKKLEFLKKTFNWPANTSKDDLRRHAASHGILGDLEDILRDYEDRRIVYDGTFGPHGIPTGVKHIHTASLEQKQNGVDHHSDDTAPSEEGITQPSHHTSAASNNRLLAEPHINGNQMSTEMQARREALLAALDGGGVYATSDPHGAIIQVNQVSDAATDSPIPSGKRARLDIAGSQRLLLGSLGVKVPKTAEDREKTQQKLAAQAQRKPVNKTDGTGNFIQAEEDDNGEAAKDPEYWRSYINLSAYECAGENVDLGEPPFPYYHYWNESQQSGKKRKRESTLYMAKKSNKQTHNNYADMYDGQEADGGQEYEDAGNGLNYDDAEDAVDIDTPVDNNSTERLTAVIEADLPLPPSNVEVLALTTVDKLHVGDIVVFRQLEVSAETKWQPAMGPRRTARVMSISNDQVVQLKLAKRDMPQHEYDEEGQRVYSKFEMEDADGDEEGVVFASKDDLAEIRFLCASQTAVDESVIISNDHDITVQAAVDAQVVEDLEADVDDTIAGLDQVMEGED